MLEPDGRSVDTKFASEKWDGLEVGKLPQGGHGVDNFKIPYIS